MAETICKIVSTLGLVICVAYPGQLDAEETNSATDLLNSAFLNLYDCNYIQEIELIIETPGSRPVSKELQIIRKQSSRPGKALIRFLEPYDIRRTSVLILENELSADDVYVYLPAIRMIRRISSAQRADAFFGTDLNFEDIEPKTVEDYLVKRASYKVRKNDCVDLEILPLEHASSTYDAMNLCIDSDQSVIHAIDYFRKGKLIKQLDVDVSSFHAINGRWIPFAITMRTVRTRSETRIITKRYDVVGAIPEAIFTARNLESGDAASDRKRIAGSD